MLKGNLLAERLRAKLAPATAASTVVAPPSTPIAAANLARDARRWREAGELYAEVLREEPENGPIHVQAGHMFKEAGDHDRAEMHYGEAARLMPDDADLALQLGHFFKVSHRPERAEAAYRRALTLDPTLIDARRELVALRDARPDAEGEAADTVEARARTGDYDELVPELMPRPLEELQHANGESIHLRRLGRPERSSRWGVQTTLRGVEAIRGFCFAAVPILEVQILLNGRLVHSEAPRAYPLANERENFDLRKCVFNAWIDLSTWPAGRYHLELRFLDADATADPQGGRRVHRQFVMIEPPLPEPRFEGGDAWTPPTDPTDPRPVDAQVNARPSLVSPARRAIFKTPPRNVLALRTDQLGDVVASVPAMLRLRELLPEAHLVGLFTSANVDLVRTLGVFDEIIVIDFPDEKIIQRKRVMTPENQEALRQRLAPYKFDLALDLAPAVESRPLLLLAGAAFTAGMRDKNWPYITAGFDLNTYDPVGRSDIMPASSKTMAFVESLGVMMNSPARVLRRPELTRERLAAYGIGPGEGYVILHTGARVVFSRWAHYPELARRTLAHTGLKVIMLSEDPATRGQLPAELADDPRFRLLDGRLPFDDFDALLSFCTVFVGNDSGPKHLAALRGSPVVSLHTPRINWGEWGQEQTGVVIHRQVPCAGCHIYHEPEECGRDYVCVTQISPDEVWGAMRPYLEAAAADG